MSKPMKINNNDISEILRDYFSRSRGPKLTPGAFTVWASLLVHSLPYSGYVSVSRDTVLEWTGIGSKNTLVRALDELIKKGFLVRVETSGQRNLPRVYRVGVPAKQATTLADLVSDRLDVDLVMEDLGLPATKGQG